MVCAVGSSKMAVMAKLLAAGNFSKNITEKVGRQKLVSHYIHHVFQEADEANLLDEKDMDIFGLKPMEDPLYLVSCNTCKKPVQASHYKAHAEVCVSLITKEGFFSELDCRAVKKKPLRKEKKKSITAGSQKSSAVLQERPKIVDASHDAASGSCLVEQNGEVPSFLVDERDVQRFIDVASARSNYVARPRSGKPAVAVIPPSKRPKLVAADMRPTSDGIGTAQDATNCFVNQKQFACPVAPLATKMYFPQRSNSRLRFKLSRMYHETVEGEQFSNRSYQMALEEGHMLTWQCTSSGVNSDGQSNEIGLGL